MTKKDDETEFGAALRTRDARTGEKKTVEVWAAAKGFLPDVIIIPAAHPKMIPPAPRPNPETWKFNGARAGSKWPQGAEVTEAEFDAAIDRTVNGVIR